MKLRSMLVLVALVVTACKGSETPVTPTNTTTNPPGSGGGGGGGGTGGTGNPSSADISVQDNSFAPPSTTVALGATVTWSWTNGYSSHNVTFETSGLGASPTQLTGTYSKTFNTAGTYKYFCSIHGAAGGNGMAGTVVVQ